ncbi:MAG: oligosaccharide flippase family protein, partial [bacterium]
MFAQIRRLLRHSLVYGLGHILSRMVSFLLLPYFTHCLNPEEYGAVTLLHTFIALALVFYIYGFDTSFVRYYILEKDSVKRDEIFSTIFWMSLVSSGVFTVLISLSAGILTSVVFDNPETIGNNTIYLVLLCGGILLTDTLGSYPYLYLRAVEKSLLFISLKVFGVILHVALTIIFLSVFHRGVAGIFEANLIASTAQLLLLLPIIFKNVKLTFKLDHVREFARFGLPNVPSQMFVMLVELADRKILELLIGLSIVGLYSAGYKLGLFMAVVSMGFRFAWHPFFLSIADRPDA